MKVIQVVNFKKHQRISGTELQTVSEYPACDDENGSNLEALSKQQGSQEGKGKERKGKGEEALSLHTSSEVIFDIESELKKNQADFESICLKTHRARDFALKVLAKFHLWNIEKENYPRSKKSLYAGFEKWLLNENDKNGKINGNGSHKPIPEENVSGSRRGL